MTLLEADRWTGQVFVDGWEPGGGGDYAVMEPATGNELGRLGIGVGRRRRPRRGARGRGPARLGRLRRTRSEPRSCARRATCGTSTAEEIAGGSSARPARSRRRRELEAWFAASSATRRRRWPSLPYGELLPDARPDLSCPGGCPSAWSGVISPFNFPLILSIRAVAPALALGNAVILKPDPRTAVSGGVVARPDLRGGRPARRPVRTCCPAAPTSARRWSRDPSVADDLVHRLDARPAAPSARSAAEHLEAGPPRARRQLGADRAGRRRPREGRRPSAALGSFMHQGQVCMTTGRHLVQREHRRRVRRRSWPSTPTTCRSATRHASRSRSARSSTRSSATGSTGW